MITLTDILNKISAVIAEVFPERYVHINQMPDQYERPAFYLDLVTTRRTRNNVGVDETEIYLTLTITEKLTVERKGDQLAALQDMETVLGLFRMEKLPVGDRVLPVKASSGGQSEGEAYVELTVTLREAIGYEPGKGLAQIESVLSTISVKGDEIDESR